MTKRQVILVTVLLTFGALALLAVVYLPMFGGHVVREAALSPIGKFAMVIMVGGAVVVGLLCLVLRRCSQRPHTPIREFFSEEGGSAALEMLLALPIIIIVMLIILQGTLMWNSNLIFHYSVYGAARSMAAVIPSYLDDSGEEHCMMYADPPQENGELSPDSLKYYQIRLAAVSSLVPISGRLPPGVDQRNPYMSGDEFAAATTQAMSIAAAATNPYWMNRVASQYRYADYFLQLVIDIPDHWNYAEPERGRRCPYQAGRREWGTTDWYYIPYCPHVLRGVLDYPPWEKVKIGVSFPYELGVPYASKLVFMVLRKNHPELVQQVILPGSSQTSYQLWLDKELEFILSG